MAGLVTAARTLNISVLLLLSITSTSQSTLSLIPILQSKYNPHVTLKTLVPFRFQEHFNLKYFLSIPSKIILGETTNTNILSGRRNFISRLLTRHMLKQLQPCKPFHPIFWDLDTGLFLQRMQHHQDPAIVLFKAKYGRCTRKQYHDIWFSKVIDNNVTTMVWSTKGDAWEKGITLVFGKGRQKRNEND